jgi:1,4-alpha-glucan branching enzyme
MFKVKLVSFLSELSVNTVIKTTNEQMTLSYDNPHSFLGLHDKGVRKIIRLWRPKAEEIHIELFGEITSLKKDSEGLFSLDVPKETTYLDYRIFHQDGSLSHDPYSFSSCFGKLDQYYFGKGVHYELHHLLGGRLKEHEGILGASFTLWAPNASKVSIVGDFNHWNGEVNPLRKLGGCGIWEIFIPGLDKGQRYKFEITDQKNKVTVKSDPYGLSFQRRPETASVLDDPHLFSWSDESWFEKRKNQNSLTIPMNTYEVHLGSWMRQDGEFMGYRDLAKSLAKYVLEMGFNYIELLPITEHPLDESWGYQVSGYFAATSRFGNVEDFQWFVNHMHENGIGVIIDWVPGHFPSDDFALQKFDGTSLFEHEDPRKGWHPHWNTHIFDFTRPEVTGFLINSALFWLEQMHIDGLRVDAVASMLYLDYGREEGEWIPNCVGGRENLEAIEFLKHFNSIVHEKCPGIMTIAEESTAFPGVTASLEDNGLGFDFKWNMGWMNDTLSYFEKDSVFRKHHHHQLTFGLLYAFSENYVLPFSHDEVVHGKKSMLSKMPGDDWQKFANLRLLYSYMICQPGKNLLFMGGELAVREEWNSQKELPWEILKYPCHQGMQDMVKVLNNLVFSHPALYEKDCCGETFEWINFSDDTNSVISYLRKSNEETLLCIHNFTPQHFPHYQIFKDSKKPVLKEIFNSDDQSFGGSGKVNLKKNRLQEEGIIELAPLSTIIFKL